MTTGSADYERGVVAGAIETRLAGHDRHFEAINGHLADVADKLGRVELALQRLADQVAGRDATLAATEAALRNDGDARDRVADRHWTPVQRLSVVLTTLLALVALYAAVRGLR